MTSQEEIEDYVEIYTVEILDDPIGPCVHDRCLTKIEWGLSGGYWERQACMACGHTFGLPSWVDAERKVFDLTEDDAA